MKHHYGPNFYLIENTFLQSLLTELCQNKTSQPQLNRLVKEGGGAGRAGYRSFGSLWPFGHADDVGAQAAGADFVQCPPHYAQDVQRFERRGAVMIFRADQRTWRL